MGMPATRPITTIEELLALPDDGMRHELLNGVHVVTPSPINVHQRVVRSVFYALDRRLALKRQSRFSGVRPTSA